MNALNDHPVVPATKTTCPYCGVGCGVVVRGSGGTASIKGDPDHPANFGRLCSKGAALGETLGLEGRLLYPQMGGQRVSWDTATSAIARKFSQTIRDHGPDSVAFYVSGQILIEDYYVANKLMKGFIGSANIDTNSRLCMASSVAGHKRAFGSDTVPGCYEDLELADLIVLVGSNLAWCHPVLFQRISAAKKARPQMRVVVIDPRQTSTCDIADLHLKIAPGGDVALFQGLFKSLEQDRVVDRMFVKKHTNNMAQVIEAAMPFDVFRVAEATNLSIPQISTFYNWFAATERTVSVYSQGVNQAIDGTDRVNAIINAHLLTGRIGKPGMGPFSVTGQPDAMGGREVGGLANQLASHMELDRADHRERVQRFWQSPTIAHRPGFKAVNLFDAVYDGTVKAIWIMATNPVVSMPNADHVRDALDRCDMVVVSDVTAQTDTAACADILLPSTAWGEKSGMVTNSERRMSRQRSFLAPPAETKHDWRQFCDVAQKMGWGDAFSFASAHEVFTEYAALCAFENNGQRDLDLSGLKNLRLEDYESFKPTFWPVRAEVVAENKRLFADGKFFTKNRRANFVAPDTKPSVSEVQSRSLILNTGRVRDQWHTMTRTGKAATLSKHICEPYVELSPKDAEHAQLRPADIARLRSPYGSMLARVLVTERQQDGTVFVPMHWTEEFASQGRVDALAAPVTDPISGQPALKSTPVEIQQFEADWFGFVVMSGTAMPARRTLEKVDYWAAARTSNGFRFELAGRLATVDGPALTALLLSKQVQNATRLEYQDEASGTHRAAFFHQDVLVGAAFFGPGPVKVSRSWICGQLGTEMAAPERKGVLAGHPGADRPDPGAIVCSCMSVGANDIKRAVGGGCRSVEAIGRATQAGTNCGSCLSELAGFLPEAVDA